MSDIALDTRKFDAALDSLCKEAAKLMAQIDRTWELAQNLEQENEIKQIVQVLDPKEPDAGKCCVCNEWFELSSMHETLDGLYCKDCVEYDDSDSKYEAWRDEQDKVCDE